MHQVFTNDWAAAWAEHLNQNTDYKKAAKNWEWPVVLIMEKTEEAGIREDRKIYLDLWKGNCRAARIAAVSDLETSTYIISATYQHWRQIFDGDLDPMMALMRGKLKLQKGNLLKLARYSTAAKQLVIAATQVPTQFPDDNSYQPKSKTKAAAVPTPANVSNNGHSRFVTTSERGLQHNSFPMRLYHKAKKFGIWNPQDIDFTRDREDWQRLDDLEKDIILHLTSLFQAGEESVTLDLLPLIMVIAKEGRLEEEMYLTTFLWEEAKHTEFFNRFLTEVAPGHGDLTRFHNPSYRKIFYEELPAAMDALLTDPSPAAQLRASVTYNMLVEGVLAETGYHGYYSMLDKNNLMPGMLEGIGYLKRDESRHIAYGIYLLSRLVAADPPLMKLLEKHMERLLELAIANITATFEVYDIPPFGLKVEDYLEFAMKQFEKRMTRIERAIDQPLEKIDFELESDG